MMYYGACYYPEHWPEERWAKDAQMMKEARFNVVRLAEFAWIKLEPQDGQYEFAWLDKAINLMKEQGIKIILGTPTAGPPKWLMDKHPDIYQRDIYGHVRGFGTRRHYCFNNENFHRYTVGIVTAMAKHYGNDSDVIGWQIDNEFGIISTTRCYCDGCLHAFRKWLKVKYGTVEAVNDAWGTIFSSQLYSNWAEIHLPTFGVHQHHSPGFALDFNRFSSDSVLAYQKLQSDILRYYAPNQLVTHNMMGKFNEINGFKLAEDLDLCSLDVYPNLKSTRPDRPAYSAEQHDMTRGFKGRNFWVLEHQSGTPGAVVMGPTPAPGELRRWTMQSVAHGADAIVYFRWRTLNFSIETFWHGILQHHGAPGRKYEEVKGVGAELEKLAPLLAGTTPQAKVGMIRSYDNEWSLEFQPHVTGYEYIKHWELYYRYFYDRNITVDIISPIGDFSGYDILVAPNLMMATDETIEQLYAFVRRGGRLVMDFRAGSRLMDNSMSLKKLPGAFAELLGIEIEDYGIMEEALPNRLRFTETIGDEGFSTADGGQEVSANIWYDVIELNEAKSLAVYTSNYFAGVPAVTRRAYGSGAAFYLGTEPDTEGIRIVMDRVVAEANVLPVLPNVPAGVEAASRRGENGRELIFVINHSDDIQKLPLSEVYVDELTDKQLDTEVALAAQDILVLRKV
jgi:beta-galactosidase